MTENNGLFDAKLQELSAAYADLQKHIAALESADPEKVHKAHRDLENEWADTVVDLKARAQAMRYFTAQQLSSVQLEYCRKAQDLLNESMKRSWANLAGDSESDNMALYAEYAIDFATLAMRHALLAAAAALDVQNDEQQEETSLL